MNYIDIIAVIDNDSKKWGTRIEGYVIQCPEILEELTFDKIAVSTYDFYDEITYNLVHKYHFDARCIMKVEDFFVPELFDTGTIILKDVAPNEAYDFKDLLSEKMIFNNKFEEFFFRSKHRIIHKAWHYFEIYEMFFSKYKNKAVRMLEIGVNKGGSLQMWKYYFKAGSEIVGIDIDEVCKDYEEERIHICIGSQENEEFLHEVVNEWGPFDIILDDGSHMVNHQIVTFEILFPLLADGGIYMCEDVHTSYWEAYGGGLYKSDTFIEYSKNMVDEINYANIRDKKVTRMPQFKGIMKAIHYYDSMVVIEKQKKGMYFASYRGNQTI